MVSWSVRKTGDSPSRRHRAATRSGSLLQSGDAELWRCRSTLIKARLRLTRTWASFDSGALVCSTFPLRLTVAGNGHDKPVSPTRAAKIVLHTPMESTGITAWS